MRSNNLSIKVDDVFSLEYEVTSDLVIDFAFISGDTNPIHMDDDVASKTIFGKRVAHGMLTASFISAVFGTQLPGVGWVYIRQTLKFIAPVYINDIIVAEVKVNAIVYDNKDTIVGFDTICFNKETNKKVLIGVAELMAP